MEKGQKGKLSKAGMYLAVLGFLLFYQVYFTGLPVPVLAAGSAPSKPTLNAPSPNGTTVGVTSPTLNVTVTDPEGDSMNVTFRNSSDNVEIGMKTGVASGSSASEVWSGLNSGNTYLWHAVADDGNSTTLSDDWSFTVDTEAPSITIDSPKGKTYGTDSVDLNVSADETVDTWQYSLDGGPNQTFTPNTTLVGLSDGDHSVEVYANDTIGNMGSASRTFTVDTPLKYSQNSTNSTEAGKPTEFRLKWTDDTGLSGYIFSLNNCGDGLENESFVHWHGPVGDTLRPYTHSASNDGGSAIDPEKAYDNDLGDISTYALFDRAGDIAIYYFNRSYERLNFTWDPGGVGASYIECWNYTDSSWHRLVTGDDTTEGNVLTNSTLVPKNCFNSSGNSKIRFWQYWDAGLYLYDVYLENEEPETQAWSNVTKTVSSTVGCNVQWCYYTNDSSGNWNGSSCENPFSFTTTDTTPPTYSDNTTNSTKVGKPTEFRLKWTDNAGLSGYIFSLDNCTGSFENESWVGWNKRIRPYSWSGSFTNPENAVDNGWNDTSIYADGFGSIETYYFNNTYKKLWYTWSVTGQYEPAEVECKNYTDGSWYTLHSTLEHGIWTNSTTLPDGCIDSSGNSEIKFWSYNTNISLYDVYVETETQAWSKVTKTVNSTVGCTVQWCVYANDTSNNWNRTSCDDPFSFTTTDTTPPTYSNVGDNSSGSVADGEIVKVYTYWSDAGSNLDTGEVYHNASGAMSLNKTCDLSGASAGWCNLTIDTAGMGGKTVCWKQWANDTAGNWNDTMGDSENCFQVESVVPPGVITVSGRVIGWNTGNPIPSADVTVKLTQDETVLDTGSETTGQGGYYSINVNTTFQRGEKYALQIKSEKGGKTSYVRKEFIYHG